MPHYVTKDTAIEAADASAYADEFARTRTILLVGVGGQGTILAGNILAMTAAEAGLDVKVSEIHGMSQRGGSVSTTIRVGQHVESMIADPGTVDVLVAFEAMEALRYQQFVAPGGKIFVNDASITPVPVNIGTATMPERVPERLAELGATLIDADGIAREIGSPRSANVVLVGALSTALPFSTDEWEDAVRRRVPPKTIDANLAAFRLPRAALETLTSPAPQEFTISTRDQSLLVLRVFFATRQLHRPPAPSTHFARMAASPTSVPQVSTVVRRTLARRTGFPPAGISAARHRAPKG